MSTDALPCIVCGNALPNVSDDATNQPSGGTAFMTHGHYGSTAFDPMDGNFLELNVCDGCLESAGRAGRVLLGRDSKPVVAHVGPDALRHMPVLIGYVKVQREPVPWHPGLEDEGAREELVLEPEEIGSDQYPEVTYMDGILEWYGPNATKDGDEDA